MLPSRVCIMWIRLPYREASCTILNPLIEICKSFEGGNGIKAPQVGVSAGRGRLLERGCSGQVLKNELELIR